jgi:hypothetical protein
VIRVIAVFALTVSIIGYYSSVYSTETDEKVIKMIFEERRIEGKIRRPQLVLIKAEQRPDFEPMVIQSLGKTGSITGSIDESILDRSPYEDAFKIRNGRIENYVP